MLLAGIIICIAIVSVALSYWSLKNDMKKHKHVEEVKKNLAKGKVVFYSPNTSK